MGITQFFQFFMMAGVFGVLCVGITATYFVGASRYARQGSRAASGIVPKGTPRQISGHLAVTEQTIEIDGQNYIRRVYHQDDMVYVEWVTE